MTTFVINIHSPRFFCSPLYLFKQKNRNPEREREKTEKGSKGFEQKNRNSKCAQASGI